VGRGQRRLLSCGRTQGTTPTVRRSSRISAALWSPR
jgi:hypothetical protein